MLSHLPLIVTPGDPAGIGAEITVKSWHAGYRDICMIDSPDRVANIADKLCTPLTIKTINHPRDFRAGRDVFHIIPIEWPVSPVAGSPDSRNGQVVINAISTAVQLCRANAAAAIVTNPIQKSTLYEAGFNYPGHTEFLASFGDVDIGGPMMMLACEDLKVVPLTVHLPITEVASNLSKEAIIAAVHLLDANLKKFFSIATPKIAVTGLNPHAGENGAIGREDYDIIQPAINCLQNSGIYVSGPHSADTLFHAEARKTYDVVLGMYHDQVLIPIKTLDFFGGVNITLGLDFIRTSPDHGTGMNIAGSGLARPDSFIAAIKMASKMATADGIFSR